MVERKNDGKQFDQKIKPLLIYEYLKQMTDENHFVSAKTIKGYIEDFGISTSIPSIYRDIEEINKAILLVRDEAETIQEAEELIEENGDKYKTIICVRKKGYRINYRKYCFEDVRLMVECIYASRFISKEKSETLTDLLKEFVSEERYNEVKHDVEVVDRAKVQSNQVFEYITLINNAMRRNINHTPNKIRFKYMTISPKDRKTKIERRNGRAYIVSPYKLIINDDYYYLLGYDDETQKLMTYRVDRMEKVRELDVNRVGEEEYKKINIEKYLNEHFSMFAGKIEDRVEIQFTYDLLDTIKDKFPTENFHSIDKKHFSITPKVSISDQFFGWICGFGNKAKILSPDCEKMFIEYLDKIRGLYKKQDK